MIPAIVAVVGAMAVNAPAWYRSRMTVDFFRPDRTAVESESRLRDWLAKQSDAKQKLDVAVEKGALFATMFEHPQPLERMPGMTADPLASCQTLEQCPKAILTLRVDDPKDLRPAIVAMIRPWMLLQQARKKELIINIAAQDEDRLLAMGVEGLILPSIELYVEPSHNGSYSLSFRSSADIATIYEAARSSFVPIRPKIAPPPTTEPGA